MTVCVRNNAPSVLPADFFNPSTGVAKSLDVIRNTTLLPGKIAGTPDFSETDALPHTPASAVIIVLRRFCLVAGFDVEYMVRSPAWEGHIQLERTRTPLSALAASLRPISVYTPVSKIPLSRQEVVRLTSRVLTATHDVSRMTHLVPAGLSIRGATRATAPSIPPLDPSHTNENRAPLRSLQLPLTRTRGTQDIMGLRTNLVPFPTEACAETVPPILPLVFSLRSGAEGSVPATSWLTLAPPAWTATLHRRRAALYWGLLTGKCDLAVSSISLDPAKCDPPPLPAFFPIPTARPRIPRLSSLVAPPPLLPTRPTPPLPAHPPRRNFCNSSCAFYPASVSKVAAPPPGLNPATSSSDTTADVGGNLAFACCVEYSATYFTSTYGMLSIVRRPPTAPAQALAGPGEGLCALALCVLESREDVPRV